MEKYRPLFKQRWVTINLNFSKIEEELRFSDLKKSAGMSDFTKHWRSERNKELAPESQLAKLSDVIINKSKGYITFNFYTAPTYSSTAKVTSPKSGFSMKKTDSVYEMSFRVLKFFEWARTKPNYKSTKEMSQKELKEILEVADVQVFCNCPSFQWQGMNYNMSMFDASIYPTNIPPKQWSPRHHHDDQFLCKHLGGLINAFSFWLNPMASMLTKKIRSTL